MPWHIVTVDGRFCVALQGSSTPIAGGCHGSRPEAERHMAALYASNPEARTAGVTTAPLEDVFPVPEYQPASWFLEPPYWVDDWRREHGYGAAVGDDGILRLTITDEGRAGGWFYPRDACLLSDPGACPVPSPTRYAAFHQQDVVCEDGTVLLVGAIGNSAGHVDAYAPLEQAMARYNDPRLQVLRVRAGDDERGGWIAGGLVPAGQRIAAGVDPLTYGTVSLLRSSALSGTWYPMPDWWWRDHGIDRPTVRACQGYDCIGPQLVTGPDLPLVRQLPRAASIGVEDLDAPPEERPIIVGGWGGVRLAPPDPAYATATDPATDPQEEPVPPEPSTATDGQPATTAAAGPPQARPDARDTGGGRPDARGQGDQPGTRLDALEAAVDEIRQTVTGIINHLRGQDQQQQQASIDAKLASVSVPQLPVPDGIFEKPTSELAPHERAWLASASQEDLDAAWIAASMSSGSINDLPDSAFAHIEAGGKKDAQGKTTPRSKRHFPVHDAAHTRNALARLPQSEFGDQAKSKVCSAASKFNIKSDVCSG